MDDVAELHAFHRDLLRDGPEPGRIHALAEVPLEVGEEPEDGVEVEVTTDPLERYSVMRWPVSVGT